MKTKQLSKGKKALIIIISVLTVVVLISFGVFWYYQSNFGAPNVKIGAPSDDAVAETVYGDVRGYISDGIYTYHNIPYAEAAERFVPAKYPEPWDGVLDTVDYGKISPQGAILGMSVSDDPQGTDNNCQNLNVWTPSINDDEKRPVMVWLHGGGFSMGSANDASYDGTALAKSGDVVVVGVNHRLNVYGHLNLSAYGEKYKYSANVGMMDIIAALEWVRDNIENFGGDPENVTVFGQSGGGAKVLSLMTSPYASKLFHKGIVQSGATEIMGVTFTKENVSKRVTENLLAELGISADNIEDLQTVPNIDLQNAAGKALQKTGEEFDILAPLSTDYGIEWGPVIEGDFMPTDPVTENGFAEAGKDIPLLIGSNLNEWTKFMSASAHNDMTDEQIAAFSKAYPDVKQSEAKYADSFIRLPMLKIMSAKADQGGAPVYAYVFTYGNSYHGAELPYVFAHRNNDVSKRMSEAWVNFARNGVPSAEGTPQWESYDRENGSTMIIDSQFTPVYHHDAELMKLLEPDYKY